MKTSHKSIFQFFTSANRLFSYFVTFVFCSVFSTSSSAQTLVKTYLITTIAGNGNLGFLGDSGAAVSAELYYPAGVAADNSGNLYIADAGNERIRKVNANGIITTIAGNGTSGFSGNGHGADSAALDNPAGVAVDDSGNVYIADANNNRIRKVNKNGIISTFAGGGTHGLYDGHAADSATLNYPVAIAMDDSGNVYIADNGNVRIRKVNTKGIITTVAGNGIAGFSGDGGMADTATFNNITGVAADTSGNVYIADANNNRIRKVNKNGIISTVAGGGVYGLYNGHAADSATLYQPAGVAVDDSGNVYIADENSNRIRKVSTKGIINTIAGMGTRGYSGDGGIADTAKLNQPVAVALDNKGNVYLADLGSLVRKLSVGTVTGIEYYTVNYTINIYPNPSTGIFNVTAQTLISSIVVMNATGQPILTQPVNATTATIDLSSQPKGLYFYKINGTALATGKLVVE